MSRPLIYFGSSFNPVTHAHLALVKHLVLITQDLSPRPLIMLSPVYLHVFNKPDWIDFEHRLHCLHLAVDEWISQEPQFSPADLIVSPIEEIVYHEAQAEIRTGTWSVIQALQARATDLNIDPKKISLALGADTFMDLVSGRWLNSQKILETLDKFYVFDRPGVILDERYANKRINCSDVIPEALRSISSTQARQSFKLAQRMVPPSVLAYLVNNRLYDWSSPEDKALLEAFHKKNL